MTIFKKAADLRAFLGSRSDIGFVPTMGALHAGHRSLIEKARQEGCYTVCSIFINPTQFNDKTDLKKYPVTIEADIALLTSAGCDVLFLPDEKEVYPEGEQSVEAYDFGKLEAVLEGAQRPGHFRGVGQVVGRLLDIVKPRYLYMGQKDFQQCIVVKDLIRQIGLEGKVEFRTCPTVREPDGLAMSSRNRRLTDPQRALAGIIYQCLVSIQTKQNAASFAIVNKECRELLTAKGFEPEYVALANAETFEQLDEFSAGVPMVALIAAKLGGVRLIDNVLLSEVA